MDAQPNLSPAPNGHIPKIIIGPDGLIRCDGLVIGRRVMRDGEIFLQVPDRDRRRVSERGSRFLEISIQVLFEAMQFDWPSSFRI